MSYTIEGSLVNPDDLGEITVTRSDAENGDVGTYDLTVNYTENPNYEVTAPTGTYTISEADTLEVYVPTDTEKVYDGEEMAPPAGTNIEGSKISYSTDGGETWTTEPPAITDAGEINVIVKVENPNYKTVTDEYILKVTPKKVTVTADNKAKFAGNKDPEFTAVTEGVIESERARTSAEIQYTITREEGEQVGTYDIIPEGEKYQGNYEVEFVPGTLTIAAVPVEKYSLTINYIYEDGTEAAPSFTGNYEIGEEVGDIESPVIEGFTPSSPVVSVGKWVSQSNLVITVIYSEDIPVIDDPSDDPGIGEEDDPIGPPRKEPNPPRTVVSDGEGNIITVDNGTGTPVGNVVLDTDDDGNIIIRNIEEEDPPLSNLDLDDAICILHWIILLIALICGIIYFITNNKLRRKLDELEKGNK